MTGTHVREWNTDNAPDRIDRTIATGSGQFGALSRLSACFKPQNGRIGSAGLVRQCRLLLGGRDADGTGADDPHGAAEEDDEGEEGEGLLFGWSRHGTKMPEHEPIAVSIERRAARSTARSINSGRSIAVGQ
jgi:hypothetical protein